jgi:hypothetical protein
MISICYPSSSEVARAVDEFNGKFSCGEGKLWNSAQCAWQSLQSSPSGPDPAPLNEFVWAVKTWGRIRGVREDEKSLVAKALVGMQGQLVTLKGKLFAHTEDRIAVQLVQYLVDGICRQGIKSEHYSWASKILHWLLPDHIPVYDEVVRRVLGVRHKKPSLAYQMIAQWEYTCVNQLESTVVGQTLPRTLLRAIDKYLWWVGTTKLTVTYEGGVLKLTPANAVLLKEGQKAAVIIWQLLDR